MGGGAVRGRHKVYPNGAGSFGIIVGEFDARMFFKNNEMQNAPNHNPFAA